MIIKLLSFDPVVLSLLSILFPHNQIKGMRKNPHLSNNQRYCYLLFCPMNKRTCMNKKDQDSV